MRSFVAKDEAATPSQDAPVAPEAAAPASKPQASTTTAVATRSMSPYVDGEIAASDLRMPFLGCVQAVGPKSVLFAPGTIVLGETPITSAPAKPTDPTPRLRILFCKVNKTYMENLPYNQSPTAPKPRIFKTAAEVAAIGGVTEWRGNVAPTFVPKVTSLILVRAPKDLDDLSFNIIDGTSVYAPAMIGFQKTSYGAAKTLLTDLSLSLKGDPTATFYDLFWSREQRGQNWVWVAKLVRVRDERPSDALKAQAVKLSGSNTETPEDDE